jgi:hypothetical protein
VVQAQRKTVARSTTTPVVSPAPVRVVSPARVQADTLRVSSPSDPAEREAESTAKKIMRMPERAGPPARSFGSPYVARFAAPIVARQAEARRETGPALQSELAAAQTSGRPLPPGVRAFMEPRFRADFGGVRIHTGDKAAALSASIGARAFAYGNQIYFGKDRFRPETTEGRELIAHELTHTIQQGAAVQRCEDVGVTQASPVMVQGSWLSEGLDWIAGKANDIPFFRLFTILLGTNPINMAAVDRSPANLLRAVIEIIPGGGLIRRALDNHGVIDKAAAWIAQQIATLGLAAGAIRTALVSFVNGIGASDILLSPFETWRKAKQIFTEPIDRAIAFIKGLAGGVIELIKDAILRPLAGLAQGMAGYDLLRAVLEKDPVTGDPYPRNPDTVIGGFMKLAGQSDVWATMQQAKAVPRAWTWFQKALAGLIGFVREIPALFIAALKSLGIADIVVLPMAFAKVGKTFGNFVGRFISWAGETVWNLLEIVFDVVSPGALGYVKRTGAALKSILKNPLPFVGNLVRAAKAGFVNFGANFLGHLKAGLIEWLTGSLPGVYIPKAFSLLEIVKFVLSVLGLTWTNIRQKLVKAVGETAVKAMETGFDIVMTLVTQGPAAAWDKIKDQLANLKDMVIGGITDLVVDAVVKKAIPKLLAMFIPGAGFISAILSIYDTVMVFVQKISKIVQVVTAFINSIVAIAAGQIGAAAARVESILAGLLSLAISFLAGFAGLGNVASKIMGVIQKIRAPIDKALDGLITWIVATAKKAFKFFVSKAKQLLEWWKLKKTFAADGESHAIYFSGEKRAARLIVASDPTPLPQFLAQKQADPALTDAQRDAIKAIQAEIPKIDAAKLLPEDQYEKAQTDIEAAIAAIIPQLGFLLSGVDYGSPLNPLPIEYTKRRAGRYPVIYIGPRCSKRIEQQWLKDGKIKRIEAELSKEEKSDWAKAGQPITPCYPTKQTPLPGGTIGITEPFQIEAGLRIEYSHGETKGGGLINRTLRPFGFVASAERLDGDHIVEMQLGGPNELRNLWPLALGENRSSGSLLKHEIDRAKAKIKPNKKAQINKNRFFIVITGTRT